MTLEMGTQGGQSWILTAEGTVEIPSKGIAMMLMLERKAILILMRTMICHFRMGALPQACVEGREAKELEVVACNEIHRVRGNNEG